MAFSFHLYWDLPLPAREAAVTLEVVEAPSVDRLAFWALQASFLDGAGRYGAAHLGLQWNPRFPGRGAVNWGGYDTEGAVLPGSESSLPSAPQDRNTRDFAWRRLHPYRLRIYRSPEKGWRGEVTDEETGVATVVRDLHVGGDRLGSLMVWSEMFCECTHPRSVVRWSHPTATGLGDERMAATAFRVNYQADGCPNTNVYVDEVGVCQTTGAERTTQQGSLVPVPSAA